MAPHVFAGFRDRVDAGRQLARALAAVRADDAVIVGLARGGVVVAAEVARALRLPLDALAVRKVGHPLEPEYGLGAVTPGGGLYLRSRDGLSDEELTAAVNAARQRADALDRALHARRPPVPVRGRLCLLVDDGLATGGTMVAAVRWARAEGARRVVVAVPVGAAETIAALREEADDVIALAAPEAFGAVGFWYQDFFPVEDAEVLALLDELAEASPADPEVVVEIDGLELPGALSVPEGARGIVLFAHGSGSSRFSPRNRLVARALNTAGLGTLLFDLLTPEEELDRANVFDIKLLGERLAGAHRWLRGRDEGRGRRLGYFGASTGAAAALLAAAELGRDVAAVVSRGGRPDLALPRLHVVTAPTLLIVGALDTLVLDLNREAASALRCPHELVVIEGATHLFEEPGALEQVADHATRWFQTHLARP